jgi:hypothetical protein
VARSCEKFGCREAADAAFGIDRIACVVWLENYDEDEPRHLNRLCNEHAARLTLPRGWSFDDRRERVPRLFVAPKPTANASHRAKPSPKPQRKASNKTTAMPRRTARDASTPLKRIDGPGLFDPTVPIGSPNLAPLPAASTPVRDDTRDATFGTDSTLRPDATIEPSIADEPIDATVPSRQPAYAPKFDRTSDVGGTLNATGRLLRRAFSSQTKPLERPTNDTAAQSVSEQGDHLDDFHQGDHIE